jgi:hypothetical protein
VKVVRVRHEVNLRTADSGSTLKTENPVQRLADAAPALDNCPTAERSDLILGSVYFSKTSCLRGGFRQ